MEQVAFESFGGVIQASTDNKIIGTLLSNVTFFGKTYTNDISLNG